jgi:GNAT superfamily N-acetyltransferase
MAAAVKLRPGRRGDLPGIMALVAAVGWPHRPQDVAAAMAGAKVWVAGSDEAPVAGVAMGWIYDDKAAHIGLIMVAPERQGQGLGRRLTERVIADMGGRAVMLLATAAGRPLYEKLGFRAVGSLTQHQGVFEPGPLPTKGPLRRAGPADRPALLALDRAALNAERPAILEKLFALGETHVLTDGAAVAGYSVAWAFGRGRVVGPIVAASEVGAVALFEAAARPGFTRVNLREPAPLLADHLTARSLAPLETCQVMVRGSWPFSAKDRPAVPVRLFGLASHAWG